MQPDAFCLWLKSVLDEDLGAGLTAGKTARIKDALASVFRHEIDPAMGDEAQQAILNRIHAEAMGIAVSREPVRLTDAERARRQAASSPTGGRPGDGGA